MNTLTTPPLTTLLPQLFADADTTQTAIEREIEAMSSEEKKAFMARAQTDYRGFYGSTKDVHLAVSPATATLLYLLTRASRARAVVEFGTSFGVSTIHLAAALRDNGGGRLITTEFEPSKVARASANLAAAGLSDLVEVRAGDALDTLSRGLPEEIDLLFLDGAKVLYPRVLALVEPRLREGALILADNADASPEYLARVRSPANGYLSVPFADDVELSTRIAGASAPR